MAARTGVSRTADRAGLDMSRADIIYVYLFLFSDGAGHEPVQGGFKPLMVGSFERTDAGSRTTVLTPSCTGCLLYGLDHRKPIITLLFGACAGGFKQISASIEA